MTLTLVVSIALSGCQKSSPEALWEAYVDRSKAKFAQGKWDEADKLIKLAHEETKQCASKGMKLIETLRLQAQIYKKKKRYQDGVEVCRKWLALTTKLYGPRNSQTNESQAALTQMLIQLGEYDQAEDLLNNSIETITDKYGKDDLYIAEPLKLLGCTYLAKGYQKKGEVLMRQALEIQRAYLDEDDEQLILTYRDLAHCLLLERQRESYDILTRQLAICEKSGSPQIWEVLWELAENEIVLMGMFRSAETHLSRVLKYQNINAYQKSLLRNQLAQLHITSGQLDKAQTLFQETLEDYKKNPSLYDPDPEQILGPAYQNLAAISLNRGDLKTAADQLRLAIHYESISGRKEDMPDVFHSRSLLAQVYCEMKATTEEGERTKELFWFFLSHQLENKQLYLEQSVTDDAYERIAHFAQSHANFEWGKSIFENALKRVEKKNGANSRQAGLLTFYLGKLCQRLANERRKPIERYKMGAKYFADAMRIMELNHYDRVEYWESVRRYGQCQQALGNYSQAEACYRKILQSRTLAQPRLDEAWYQLTEVLNSQGKIQEAKSVASTPIPKSLSGTDQFYLQPDQPQK